MTAQRAARRGPRTLGGTAMKLPTGKARTRLDAHVHGVLSTLHPERGPDAQPVVYAMSDDGHVGIPIDRVKPKSSSRLQREDNLAADPRGSLLVEWWETDDWSRLWWVRARLSTCPTRRLSWSTSSPTGWRARCLSTPTSHSTGCLCSVSSTSPGGLPARTPEHHVRRSGSTAPGRPRSAIPQGMQREPSRSRLAAQRRTRPRPWACAGLLAACCGRWPRWHRATDATARLAAERRTPRWRHRRACTIATDGSTVVA